jgi:transcriptional regulator with XRE-family HTH domain
MLLSMTLDIDALIRKNLRRLIVQAGYKKQNEFAVFVGVDAAYINNVLQERRSLGKDVMERICRAMKIQPWEFYVDESTPVVLDDLEHRAVELIRAARPLGVAEEILRRDHGTAEKNISSVK